MGSSNLMIFLQVTVDSQTQGDSAWLNDAMLFSSTGLDASLSEKN